MQPKPEIVRRRFILSAAMGLAMAIVAGYPISGWLMETHSSGLGNAGSKSAFHLAKAGVDRGLWSINQQRKTLDAVIKGKAVAGLDGDVVFSDIPGGTYKITARYDRQSRAIRVTSTGVDLNSGSSKTLELLLKQKPDAHGLMQLQWREVPVEQI